MTTVQPSTQDALIPQLPPHLRDWQLPPAWQWGAEGILAEYRHTQEVVDALGRSLALVTTPDPRYTEWLAREARHLAHRSHPAIPTTYHYWATHQDNRRGPGYLRRWVVGETVGERVLRVGTGDVRLAIQVLRAAGSALAYLHDSGIVAGAVSTGTIWITPTGRFWMLGWEWVLPRSELPPGVMPSRENIASPPEWGDAAWTPTPESDQWQLGAVAFAMLTGEYPPAIDAPPMRLVSPETPQAIGAILDRMLRAEPGERYPSVTAVLRAFDRVMGPRTTVLLGEGRSASGAESAESEEARLRWAVGDDYEVMASLGQGSFGSVWRVRDLVLGREVALKMLHPHIVRDLRAEGRFRREARLAAQLSHHAILPIFDFDSRGDVSWYTMELAEGGSLAQLITRSGPRPLDEIAPQIDLILDGLAAGHAVGVIHRDLKPENILIDRYGRWQIADFGIANAVGEDTATASGTPAFAAPEQILGEPQGPQADCFAVGAIVVFALTGKLPFGGGDAKTILAKQLGAGVDLEPFPSEIAAWLRRAFAPDPESRYADASEMRVEWRRAIESQRDRKTPWWRALLPGEDR